VNAMEQCTYPVYAINRAVCYTGVALDETGAGVAGKDFRNPEISGQRLRSPSHRRPLQMT
jgi:hypothetical protein